MPLYEYKCDCGNRFESIRPIAERHNTACTCGKLAKLLMSPWGRVLFASWFTTENSDGIVIGAKQTTEHTPYLPERVHGSRW